MSSQLTATEAAARLGVQRATLYAYVSRGLISRTVAMDGRSSLFDADEVERLRAGRRTATEGELATLITTRLTLVSDEGLIVGGSDLVELLGDGLTFEQVADQLWEAGPDEAWPDITDEHNLASVLSALPDTTRPLDRLRIVTSVLSAHDPLRHGRSERSIRAVARNLITAMVTGLEPRGQDAKVHKSVATALFGRLTGRSGTLKQRAAVNAALVLLIDHGLASSTFAARIAASVRGDPYSVVTAGLGVLGGHLHGAASAPVHELFVSIEEIGDTAQAIGATQERLGSIPGFGHAVYRSSDPRCGPLLEVIDQAWSGDSRLATVHEAADIIASRTEAVPNVDFALGALSYLAKMDRTAGEAIFAIARTAGWLAHAMEEYVEAPLRFRTRARYLSS